MVDDKGPNITTEEVFERMKELNADNPSMLLWIAGYSLSQRAEIPEIGDHPAPENDFQLQGFLMESDDDEQYVADTEMPSKYLEEFRHVPPNDRTPYKEWLVENGG